jgi:2',3'-cyclic-nucleotide 2'-phosphodiesterase (5'-nucleotidase family)
MPFENYVVLMRLEGGVVKQLLDHMAAKGGWPVDGVRYRIVDGHAEQIEINGRPFESRRSYAVAMPDYIANGGDDCAFLKNQPRQESDLLIREAILRFLAAANERGEQIVAETDGRVQYGE